MHRVLNLGHYYFCAVVEDPILQQQVPTCHCEDLAEVGKLVQQYGLDYCVGTK